MDLSLRDGVPIPARPPVRIIPALARNNSPVWAPDGRRFAFVSSRSGYQELWVSDRDGAEPVQWTNLQTVEVSDPRWLADGRLSFTAIAGGIKNQYVVGSPSASPQPLLPETARRAVASPDGQWIYYTRPNSLEIWRIAASGQGEPKRITEESGYNLLISPDGKTVYYARAREGESWVWGSDVLAETVAGRVAKTVVGLTDSYSPGRRGVYFAPGGNRSLAYRDLSTGAVHQIFAPSEFRLEYQIGLAPDESSLLFSVREFDSANLMTIEEFS